MAEHFNYRKRVVDSLLAEKLEAMGAVLIEGPKACGKTTDDAPDDTLGVWRIYRRCEPGQTL